MVFSKNWFKTHQKRLLKFANTYIGRYILRIHGQRSAVGKNKIILIEPNAITWLKAPLFVLAQKPEEQFVTEFRTHDKFAARLYHAFKPVWYLAHFIDWLLLDRFEFARPLNFGFATLTQYPGSGGANNPPDGYVSRQGVNQLFSAIRGANGTNNSNASVQIQLLCSATVNQFNTLMRGITCFNTSSLTALVTVSSVIYSLYGSIVDTTISGGDLNITSGATASNTALASADYQTNTASTSFSSLSMASINTSAYNDFTLDANGRANVSLTGITKYATKLNWDVNNSFTGTWISGQQAAALFLSATTAGTTQDPKIVVTYSLGGGAPNIFMRQAVNRSYTY